MKKKSEDRKKLRSFHPGTVVYPNGTMIRPEDWADGEPTAIPIDEETVDEIYPNVGGINPNPKYYVTPKEPEETNKSFRVKVKKRN